MHIEYDIKLDFKDVLIKPKRSTLASRSEVDLKRTFKFRHSIYTWTGVPVISANMDTTGTIDTALALSEQDMLTCLHKYYNIQDLQRLIGTNYKDSVALTCGSNPLDYMLFKEKITFLPDLKFICLDVANGYSERFLNFVRQVRNDYPEKIIIAGNVCTGEMTEALILAGADIVKVGIGPGASCLTRVMAGVGVPQFSAVIECSDAAHGLGGHIISDGGCATPADICKAFAGGADFVMLGGMLAGHDESGGELVEKNNKKFKSFYGMSSKKANEKYNGGLNSYRASEGRELLIPYKGPISETLQQITGGLRSACTYVGASKIKHLPKCTTFVRVNQQLNEVFSRYEDKNDG